VVVLLRSERQEALALRRRQHLRSPVVYPHGSIVRQGPVKDKGQSPHCGGIRSDGVTTGGDVTVGPVRLRAIPGEKVGAELSGGPSSTPSTAHYPC